MRTFLMIHLVLALCPLTLRAQDSNLDVVPNRGQWPEAVQARMEGPGMQLWLEDAGWTVSVFGADEEGARSAHALRLRVLDARPEVTGHAEGRRSGRRHWLLGDDPSAWVRDVPAYAQWRWPELRPGVDLVARSSAGVFEYDLLLAPEAELSEVHFAIEGVERLEAAQDGGLLLHTELGVLHQSPPVAWSLMADGSQAPVLCRAQVLGEDSFRFVAETRHAGRPLLVDPELRWASFVGGGNVDFAEDLIVQGGAGVTVVGATLPSGYPATVGAYDPTLNGGRDAVVTRLSAEGDALVFSTFLGGSFDDEVLSAASDGASGTVLAGWTASANFPITPGAHDSSFGGGNGLFASDAFVARLSSDGSELLLSSFFGGSEDDMARAVAVDDDGTLFVGGLSLSSDLDLGQNSPDDSFAGGGNDVGDAFLAAFAPGGGLVWGRYLGASGDELVNALAIDPEGDLLAAGWTSSVDFPTTPGAAQSARGGTSDAWVARFDAQNGELDAASLLGGAQDENALDIVAADDGRVLITGTSLSNDFPTTLGAPQAASAGGAFYGDVYLARFDATLSNVDFSTYLGGSADDFPVALQLEATGSVLLAGWTKSNNLPLTSDALQSAGGGTDAFVARIDPDTNAFVHVSQLGAAQTDKAAGMGLCPDGDVILAGWTSSPAFPVTSGAYDTNFDGVAGLLGDIFVARLELGLPTQSAEWFELGFGLAGSAGLPALSVDGGLLPGDTGAMLIDHAAPFAPTLLIFGADAGYQAAKQGTLVPWPITNIVYAQLDAGGAMAFAYDLGATPLPSGATMCVQAWSLDQGAIAGWSATGALFTTVP
ncbi:MAG: hypothetical protein DHS20C15_21610 [Planctomycetota bacterium]|nr:MAG: hypothetical protein DHS20C15_21610 [Planctomycetota bacterium]